MFRGLKLTQFKAVALYYTRRRPLGYLRKQVVILMPLDDEVESVIHYVVPSEQQPLLSDLQGLS